MASLGLSTRLCESLHHLAEQHHLRAVRGNRIGQNLKHVDR
jgi:hypothetical protein